MRKLAIAMALASTALATPAVATDGAWYAGLEGGPMIVQDTGFDYEAPGVSVDDGVIIDHKIGWDVDVIGGYDFGMFRVEAETAYKRAGVDKIRFDPAANILVGGNNADAHGRVSVISSNIN